MAKAGRGSDQFPLRLPPGMRDQIKRVAEESGRSMNSEILDVLREAFPDEPSLEELVESLEYSVAILRELSAESGRITQSSKVPAILEQIEAINQRLTTHARDGRVSPIVVLREKAVAGILRLQEDYDIPRGLLDGVANDLIQMSLNRIFEGQENLKVFVGEGDLERVIELARERKDE